MSTPTADQLRRHIVEDCAAIDTLLQLLHAERDACQDRQLDQLDDIIQRKARALKQLEMSAGQRSEWLKRSVARGATVEARWRHLLQQNGTDLVDSWERLQQGLVQCRRENSINGKILARQQRTIEQINTLLKGSPRASSLYGAAGRTQTLDSTHLRGEA